MTLYSGPGSVEYRGRVLRQAESIDIKFDTGNQDVDTLADGFAGHTPGVKKITVSVSAAVPSEASGGLEFNFVAAMEAQATIEFTYVVAGARYRVRGDLRSGSLTSKIGDKNGASWEHHGKLVGTT